MSNMFNLVIRERQGLTYDVRSASMASKGIGV